MALPYFSRTACELTFPATAWKKIRRNLGSWRRDFFPDGLVPTHAKSIKIAQAQFVAQKISTKNARFRHYLNFLQNSVIAFKSDIYYVALQNMHTCWMRHLSLDSQTSRKKKVLTAHDKNYICAQLRRQKVGGAVLTDDNLC